MALLNGVFSGAEIAVLSVRKTRLSELLEAKRAGAQAVAALRQTPERVCAVVQIGITVLGAAAGAFGGSNVAADLAPRLESTFGPYSDRVALGIVVSVISFFSLVLGELVPKSLALRAAERYALLIAPALWGLAWIARPLVWFLTASSNIVLRLFGDRTTFTESRHSSEELRELLGEASKAGSVHPRVGEIASRALDFGALTAGDVMVPRAQVEAIPKTASVEKMKEIFLEHGHTRMPVFDGTVDQVVGYIYAKDVMALDWERELVKLDDIVREVAFVPQTMRAVDLLQQMQRKKQHFVIVVDDSGGVAGIVTMEDLVEEFVGEIFSELDDPEHAHVLDQGDGSVIVLGATSLRDVDRSIGTSLALDTESTTVGGLCMELAGVVPKRGDRLTAKDQTSLEIVSATRQRVQRVRLRRRAPSEL